MTKKILAGFLGLSLLFNVFVLLGFAQARRAAQRVTPSDETVVKQVANELKLTEEQAKFFRDLRASSRKQATEVNEALMVLRHRLNAELREAAPDLDMVRSLVDRESELNRMRRHVGAELFSRFVDSLSPQQRQMLSQRVDPHRHSGEGPRRDGPPPFILKKFDVNRNGVLDPDEIDAAVNRIGDQRRNDRRRPDAPERGNPSPWERFDADHNGMLDADELAKMDQARRDRQQSEQN